MSYIPYCNARSVQRNLSVLTLMEKHKLCSLHKKRLAAHWLPAEKTLHFSSVLLTGSSSHVLHQEVFYHCPFLLVQFTFPCCTFFIWRKFGVSSKYIHFFRNNFAA